MAPTIMESSQREYMGADRRATGHSHSSGSIFSDKLRARSAHTTHLSSSTLTPAGACQQARKRTRRRHFLLEHENLMPLADYDLVITSRDRERQQYLGGELVDRTNKTDECLERRREYYVHPCGARRASSVQLCSWQHELDYHA